MGRIFQTRKATIFARNDRVAKAFTRIGKEIAIAVKAGGGIPENNSRLKTAINNAKGVNMPKEKVEAAIKRATSKDDKGLAEQVYEGYAPHGVAMMIECATDNTTRTISNLRVIVSKGGGTIGSQNSVGFIFDRKGVFRIDKTKLNLDEMELDLIDSGAEEIDTDDDDVIIHTAFIDFGKMQKFLEEKSIAAKSSELQQIPNNYKEGLTEEQENQVLQLIAKLEDDDDVQQVFHNLK